METCCFFLPSIIVYGSQLMLVVKSFLHTFMQHYPNFNKNITFRADYSKIYYQININNSSTVHYSIEGEEQSLVKGRFRFVHYCIIPSSNYILAKVTNSVLRRTTDGTNVSHLLILVQFYVIRLDYYDVNGEHQIFCLFCFFDWRCQPHSSSKLCGEDIAQTSAP